MLIIFIDKTLDLFMMRSPTVQVNTRPILGEEVDEAGLVKLYEKRMFIGFVYEEDGKFLNQPMEAKAERSTNGERNEF